MGVVVARGQITITALRDGAKGDAGRGIASVVVQYYLSTSKATQEGGVWQSTHPIWEKGKYLWTRTVYTYTDGTSVVTPATCSSEWEVVNLLGDGRNLFGYNKGVLFEGNGYFGSGWDVSITSMPEEGGVKLLVKAVGSGSAGKSIAVRFTRLGFGRAGWYTLSCELKCMRANVTNKVWPRQLWLNLCHTPAERIALSTEWQRVVVSSDVRQYYAEDYDRDVNSYGGFCELNFGPGHDIQVGDIIYLRHIMVERGSTPTTYRKAEEDVRAEVEHLGYLKRLFDQPTGMVDGAVFGGMLRAEEGGEVRSYINGVKGKPALALGVENFGTAAEKAITELNFDGSGHVGGLYFSLEGGEPRLYIPDTEGKERVTFSNRAVPSIQALQGEAITMQRIANKVYQVDIHDLETTVNSSNGEVIEGDSIDGRTGRVESEHIVASGSNGVMRIRGELSLYTRAYGEGQQIRGEGGGSPYMWYHRHSSGVEAILYRRAQNLTHSVRTVGSIVLYSNAKEEGKSFRIDLTLQGLLPGEYYIDIRGSGSSTNSGSYARLRLEEMTMSYDVVDRRTHVAGNGFASFYERGQWVHIENGKLQASGEINIPGVLLSGLISTGTTVEKAMPIKGQWGAKSSTAQSKRHGVGSYRVYHNVGHTDYSVQVTPRVQWGRENELPFIAVVQEVNLTDFLVYLKRYDGTKVDGEFYFTIIGRNF